MAARFGIRLEDKNAWERRAPLGPEHVAKLGELEVAVQSSATRVFSDEEYRRAGAEIVTSLQDCPVVFAIKEIPLRLIEAGKTYVFFAHVIKGQPHNMPLLRRLLELGCTLIDYEKIVDRSGRRLVLFGHSAGQAGMMDTLWALGRRLAHEGIATPFEALRPAPEYGRLQPAREAFAEAGRQIAAAGLPAAISPLVVGFAGYGNVSKGAQELFDVLPHRAIAPDELPAVVAAGSRHELYKVVFAEEHMVTRRDPAQPFDLPEYYRYPERYRGTFARHVPYLTVLVNCIFWTSKYPRLVSRDLLHGLYGAGHRPRLRVIGDISCDLEGAMECTLKSTTPGDPIYVYEVAEDRAVMGVRGHGPVVLAVDILPAEISAAATIEFGEALLPFVPAIAAADYRVPFAELQLPPPVKRAVIVYQGQLTPSFAYLNEHLGS